MLRCGFAFIPYPLTEDTIRVVRLGEELGYESAWLPDQTFYADPFVLLTACALATRRITLGLGVTNPYTRHPVVSARAAATLDQLAGGRLILGFGAGNNPELLAPLGIDQRSAAARCREAVLVAKQLLAGEEVRYRSDTMTIDGVRLLLPPRPELPVHMAARSPGTLRATGEVADGAILSAFFAIERLRFAVDIVARAAASKGRAPSDVDLVLWGSCMLTDGSGASPDAFRREIARQIGRAPATSLQTIGLPESRVNELKGTHATDGPAAVARMLRHDELALFGLVGDPDECRARLAEIERTGVTRLVLLLRSAEPDEHADFLQRFARQVLRIS